MGEHENLYEILGLDSRDIDGDGLKDLTVLARYTLPEELGPYMEELRAYVADVAMEEVMNTGNKMIEVLERITE